MINRRGAYNSGCGNDHRGVVSNHAIRVIKCLMGCVTSGMAIAY